MPVIPDLKATGGEWRPAIPSVSAAMAPGLATSDLGQSITSASQDVAKVVDRMHQMRNEDALVQARSDVMDAQTAHTAFRSQNPDPATWEADIQQRYGTIREKYNAFKLTDEGRHQLDNSLTTWTADALNTTRVDALKYEATRTRQNIANLDLKYRKTGNFKAARELQDKAVEVGVYTKVEGQVNHEDISREEVEFHKKSNFQSLYSQINFDPKEVKSLLTEKNPDGSWKNASDMESGARSQLLDQADIQIGKETFAELQLFTHSLGDYNATEAELQTMPNFLDDSQKNAVLANYRRATPPTPDELKTAWDAVDSLRKLKEDPTTSQKQYLSAYIDTHTTLLPLASTRFKWDITREMDSLKPGVFSNAEETSTTAYAQEDREAIGRSIITQARDQGSYGEIRNSDRRVRAQAILAAEKDRLALNRWMASAEKPPTPEAIQSFARNLVNERHLANTTQSHANRLPGLGQHLRLSPLDPPALTSTKPPIYPSEKKPADLLPDSSSILSQKKFENLAHVSGTGTPSLNRLPLQ